MVKPRIPLGSASSPDDDPTGVRALLSALPEPDPMPEHLVQRINASLAAEQAQRAAGTASSFVTPLLATTRRRPRRILFAMAGVAAAVALFATVGTNMFAVNEPAVMSGSAAKDSSSGAGPSYAQEDSLGAPQSADKATRAVSSPVQIRLSDTRYTQAGFVTQAQNLRHATHDPLPPKAAASALEPAGTVTGLTECLSAIGAAGAQVVRADVALYEGQPAVIIVATTNGKPVAFAVGRQCSHAHAAVLRAATPLP